MRVVVVVFVGDRLFFAHNNMCDFLSCRDRDGFDEDDDDDDEPGDMHVL
jgi:hypothetical protein